MTNGLVGSGRLRQAGKQAVNRANSSQNKILRTLYYTDSQHCTCCFPGPWLKVESPQSRRFPFPRAPNHKLTEGSWSFITNDACFLSDWLLSGHLDASSSWPSRFRASYSLNSLKMAVPQLKAPHILAAGPRFIAFASKRPTSKTRTPVPWDGLLDTYHQYRCIAEDIYLPNNPQTHRSKPPE